VLREVLAGDDGVTARRAALLDHAPPPRPDPTDRPR